MERQHDRILVVEDDPTTSRSIELMLTRANLNAYCTDLGQDAVDLAIAVPPEEWSITPLYDRPAAPAPAASDPATLAQPLPPLGWLPPPEGERTEGYRCLALIEIEWTIDVLSRTLNWYRPIEHAGVMVGIGNPGTHGFLPLEASKCKSS